MGVNEVALDEREMDIVADALMYAKWNSCGIVGHNLLNIIAKLAYVSGFDISTGENDELILSFNGQQNRRYSPDWNGITDEQKGTIAQPTSLES